MLFAADKDHRPPADKTTNRTCHRLVGQAARLPDLCRTLQPSIWLKPLLLLLHGHPQEEPSVVIRDYPLEATPMVSLWPQLLPPRMRKAALRNHQGAEGNTRFLIPYPKNRFLSEIPQLPDQLVIVYLRPRSNRTRTNQYLEEEMDINDPVLLVASLTRSLGAQAQSLGALLTKMEPRNPTKRIEHIHLRVCKTLCPMMVLKPGSHLNHGVPPLVLAARTVTNHPTALLVAFPSFRLLLAIASARTALPVGWRTIVSTIAETRLPNHTLVADPLPGHSKAWLSAEVIVALPAKVLRAAPSLFCTTVTSTLRAIVRPRALLVVLLQAVTCVVLIPLSRRWVAALTASSSSTPQHIQQRQHPKHNRSLVTAPETSRIRVSSNNSMQVHTSLSTPILLHIILLPPLLPPYLHSPPPSAEEVATQVPTMRTTKPALAVLLRWGKRAGLRMRMNSQASPQAQDTQGAVVQLGR